MVDNGVDKGYGVWHEFGPAEGIEKILAVSVRQG